ncbi:MAG: membrane integrity-associated transporter subunit PqiC [Opitutales bacterium]
MKTAHLFLATLLGLVLPLAGCFNTTPSEDPTRFFVLGLEEAEMADPSQVVGLDEPDTVIVGLRLARFPAYLDQASIAYRQGPNEIVYLPFERWAYPLKLGFSAGLTAALETSGEPLRAFAWPYPGSVRPDVEVTLWVSAFEPRLDREQAVLELRYGLAGNFQPFSRTQPLPPGDMLGQRIASAQAGTLKAFAEHLAAEIAALPRSEAAE